MDIIEEGLDLMKLYFQDQRAATRKIEQKRAMKQAEDQARKEHIKSLSTSTGTKGVESSHVLLSMDEKEIQERVEIEKRKSEQRAAEEKKMILLEAEKKAAEDKQRMEEEKQRMEEEYKQKMDEEYKQKMEEERKRMEEEYKKKLEEEYQKNLAMANISSSSEGSTDTSSISPAGYTFMISIASDSRFAANKPIKATIKSATSLDDLANQLKEKLKLGYDIDISCYDNDFGEYVQITELEDLPKKAKLMLEKKNES